MEVNQQLETETTEDAGENRSYRAGRVSGIIVRYPSVVMIICFVVSTGLAAVSFVLGSLEPMLGMEVESSILVQRYFGQEIARLQSHIDLEDLDSNLIYVPNEKEDDTRRRRLTSASGNLYGCESRHRERFEEFDIHLIFRDASGDPLSLKTLKSIELAQQRISTIPAYRDLCLHNDYGSCGTYSSIINWASIFGETRGTAKLAEDDAFTSIPWPQCLNIEQDLYEKVADKVCLKDTIGPGLPVPCSTDVSSVVYPAQGRKVLENPFRAVCIAGSSQEQGMSTTCESILGKVRSNMFGRNWKCDTLRTKYVRIVLPSAHIINDECEISEDSGDKIERYWDSELRPALFELKKVIEEKNSDITMYFSVAYPDWAGYYLHQDLRLLVVSFVVIFLVVWYNVDSFFLTCCGMYEIVISFPLGLFVWVVIMSEPGITYLMCKCIWIYVLIYHSNRGILHPPLTCWNR